MTNFRALDVPPVRDSLAGSVSPKLSSYRGTAEKCKFEGDTMRHFNAGKLATFELRAPGYTAKDVQVNIISKCTRTKALQVPSAILSRQKPT